MDCHIRRQREDGEPVAVEGNVGEAAGCEADEEAVSVFASAELRGGVAGERALKCRRER